MAWQQQIGEWMGKPVGVSFRNGQGTSGVLCGANRNVLYVMEYLYQSQFAMKQYPYNTVQDVLAFPPCRQNNRLY